MISGTLRASDGVELYWREWPATQPRRAVLVILHGVGEHGGRYKSLAAGLGARGIACFVFDHRGHGRSTGPRGHVDGWDRYESDVHEFLDEVVRDQLSTPFYLYGHSMGSLICLKMAIGGFGKEYHGFGGWVISGASIFPSGVAKRHLVVMARLLSRIFPRLTMDLGIPSTALSHDQDIVDAYDDDPLVVRRATVRWGTEALDTIKFIKREADRISDPMLLIHGGSDPLSEAYGSRWLAERVGGETDLIVYDGSLHEPHNDPQYADVLGDVLRWIQR